MRRTVSLALFLTVSLPAIAHAQSGETAPGADTEETLETVTVYGRSLELVGMAGAASEGVVGYADFEDRPLSRVGELVEVIPGVVATQHSGEGKANQYFLRGFNLDHGTDFSASVDGVPVNLRTHGHGQGCGHGHGRRPAPRHGVKGLKQSPWLGPRLMALANDHP